MVLFDLFRFFSGLFSRLVSCDLNTLFVNPSLWVLIVTTFLVDGFEKKFPHLLLSKLCFSMTGYNFEGYVANVG